MKTLQGIRDPFPFLHDRPRGRQQDALALLLWIFLHVPAPGLQAQEHDKCAYDESLAKVQLQILGDKWGYSYDSLAVDLQVWAQSPFVSVQSIGKSVQDRDLWELTISDPGTSNQTLRTVYIHARTHPGEVQSFWVTRAMIGILLSSDPTAETLRRSVKFHIVPMYNPDGVELEFPRENANGIDIESNWATSPSQPEVVALRNRFADLMWSPSPIDIALNMHSAYDCSRYFVYHDSVGTSDTFATLERQFIEGIRSYFPEGIQPWNYYISWKSGPALVYPESWFWLNYQEGVMALTYEDMNCPLAGEYDRTGRAILRGIVDFLGLQATTVRSLAARPPFAIRLGQAYPHPVSQSRSHTAVVEYELPSTARVCLALYDLLGRRLIVAADGQRPAGISTAVLRLQGLPSGTYFYRLETPLGVVVRPLIVTR
jgi:hypothetical protein